MVQPKVSSDETEPALAVWRPCRSYGYGLGGASAARVGHRQSGRSGSAALAPRSGPDRREWCLSLWLDICLEPPCCKVAVVSTGELAVLVQVRGSRM